MAFLCCLLFGVTTMLLKLSCNCSSSTSSIRFFYKAFIPLKGWIDGVMALTVFVKGSNDHLKAHKELGDCPSSQRILMILRLKGVVFQTEYVDVTKKDPKKWEEFVRRSQGRLKLPVLLHGDREPLEDANTIETYLEETFSEPCMKPSLSGKANEAGIKIYSKFALFMRNSIPGENDRKLRSDLDMELGRLDTFLKKDTSSSPPGLALKPGAFLDGDRLKLPDCNLLPKLMHIKVAGELKDFKIRREHKNVIKYLEEAAKLKAFNEIFNESVKNDIKTGWRNKMGNSSSKG